jgi:hypothetical protein
MGTIGRFSPYLSTGPKWDPDTVMLPAENLFMRTKVECLPDLDDKKCA